MLEIVDIVFYECGSGTAAEGSSESSLANQPLFNAS
jgi:hypothetical protein